MNGPAAENRGLRWDVASSPCSQRVHVPHRQALPGGRVALPSSTGNWPFPAPFAVRCFVVHPLCFPSIRVPAPLCISGPGAGAGRAGRQQPWCPLSCPHPAWPHEPWVTAAQAGAQDGQWSRDPSPSPAPTAKRLIQGAQLGDLMRVFT